MALVQKVFASVLRIKHMLKNFHEAELGSSACLKPELFVLLWIILCDFRKGGTDRLWFSGIFQTEKKQHVMHILVLAAV